MASKAQTKPAPTTPTDEASATPARIKVRAILMCYVDHVRRRPGDVFLVEPKFFSAIGMERVADDTPERVTLGRDVLRREHDEIRQAKRQNGMHVAIDVVGSSILSDDDNPLGAE